MHRRISLPQAFRFLPAVLLMAAALCAPALAADLNLATGSPSVGFTFDDKPLSLPVQENFQMALLTASGELGRTCGKTEAYGWRMKQSEQERVDQIFSSTVDRLRALGYVVETQTPASISHDVTLFSADKPDKHFIFMWSAGEIGLVMVLCESSPPLMNHNGTASYVGENPSVKSFSGPGRGGGRFRTENARARQGHYGSRCPFFAYRYMDRHLCLCPRRYRRDLANRQS